MAPAMGELERHLHEIDVALDRGDLGAARRIVGQARGLLNPDAHGPRERLRLIGHVMLTDREVATLRRLPDGSMSQKDIARDLAVTRNTVKTHLKSLYQKLGVHCRGEAIHRARELGLLPEPVAPPIQLHPRSVARTA